MLFGYPIGATADNWLHESLCQMVHTIHESIDAGKEPPPWPDIIPSRHRDKLISRTGIYDRLTQYTRAVSALSAVERQRVLTCLVQQNCIGDLLSCAIDCGSLSDLPDSVRDPVVRLFDVAFTLLTAIGVRDRHYIAIYGSIPYHVCPFCGCEYFDAPGAPREDLDHYLAKSRYPFAAANLRNLVPMGMKCNERYKGVQDILRDASGIRRRSFDPYADRTIAVLLGGSIPFAGADGQTPAWQIDFHPASPECVTWDDVFHIRERIKRDVLDPSFRRWLAEFAGWFRKRVGNPPPGRAVLSDALKIYAEDMALLGLNAREFLRAPVFQLLHQWCLAGDERVSSLIFDLVTM